jgi:hypothetical protein
MRGNVAQAPHSDGQIEPGNRRLPFGWLTLVGLLVWASVSVVLLLTTVDPLMPNAASSRAATTYAYIATPDGT